ncbi:MAG TPA: SRPBCC family protein [Steroidobacteraceae bacterium]|nr:SRPBCC family protein [Steroidobacteraceae bacterium]
MAAALLACTSARAASIETLSTRKDGDRYSVVLRAHLDVPAAAAYAVFADVSNWRRLSPDLHQLQVIARRPGGVELSTGFQACVLWFCRLVRGVPEVSFAKISGGGDIEIVFRPNVGDLRSGRAHWRFRAAGSGTELQCDAYAEPAFLVPPLIGTWLIERWLRTQATGTSANIEALARR